MLLAIFTCTSTKTTARFLVKYGFEQFTQAFTGKKDPK